MDNYKRRRDRESKQNRTNNIEMATVTSSNTGQGISAEGVGEYREIPLMAPFGIRWNPPIDCNVQLIKNWNNGKSIVAVGTIVDKELPPGEVELYSMGGAVVKLKNDGTVVINGSVIISTDGTIMAKHFVSSVHGGVLYG